MGTGIVKFLSALSMVLLLASCGGGGSSSDSDESSSGDSGNGGIPAAFDLLTQSGTWRLIVNSSFSLDSDITLGDDTVNLVASAVVRQVEVTAFEIVEDQVITTSCEADVVEPESIAEAEESLDLTDLNDDPACANETINYIKNNDSSYRVAYDCPGILSFSIDFVKLSDAAELDFGSLSFNSMDNEDLDTSTGVCGSIENASSSSVFTPQPNALMAEDEDLQFEIITVAAPYEGNRIALSFEFFNDAQPGTYTVDRLADAADEVSVDIYSVNYGGTPDAPESESATSGTVTITAIDDFSATGSYDITTESGDTVNGSFSFDIE